MATQGNVSNHAVYTQDVMDRFASSVSLENPNVGSLDKEDPNVGTGIVGAPSCGDVMKLQIKVDKNGIITDAKFKTFGCGSAIASSSLAVEWIKGKNVNEATKIKNVDIAKHLSLPPIKLHCSVLAEGAIQAAIKDYQGKKHGKTSEVDSIATANYKSQKQSDSSCDA
jgi:Fe-S cluster assembly scaffold IscU